MISKGKRYVLYIILPLFILVVFSIFYFSIKGRETDKIELKTDIEPISNHFPMLEGIENVYWISGSFGTSGIGPSDIWLKCYVILDEGSFERISSEYSWDKSDIDFDEGFEPSVTGHNSFDWYTSKDFSKDLAGKSFMGESYMDERNRIIYFDVTTF